MDSRQGCCFWLSSFAFFFFSTWPTCGDDLDWLEKTREGDIRDDLSDVDVVVDVGVNVVIEFVVVVDVVVEVEVEVSGLVDVLGIRTGLSTDDIEDRGDNLDRTDLFFPSWKIKVSNQLFAFKGFQELGVRHLINCKVRFKLKLQIENWSHKWNCAFWQMFDFYQLCLEKTKHVGIFTPGCFFPHMFGFWHICMGKGTHVWKKPHNYMIANVWHFPHMCGKSHRPAYFPLSYRWEGVKENLWLSPELTLCYKRSQPNWNSPFPALPEEL